MFELKGKRIYVAGHRGLVGSAIVRRLREEDCHVLTVDRRQLDLARQSDTEAWLAAHKPDAIFIAAALVGGIQANAAEPAEFLLQNGAIAFNLISAAHRFGVAKLMMLGAGCIYPRLAPQPMAEDTLLSGPLEPTNEGYALAKIAGLKLAQFYRDQYGDDFITVVPSNLYGPGDNLDVARNHVVPALMRRIHEAKAHRLPSVSVWGSGQAVREFLYVDDMSDGLIFLMKNYSDARPINMGSGNQISIADLARAISRVIGYRGSLSFDNTKPDGMPRKVLDSTRLRNMGWQPRVKLLDGLATTYEDFLLKARSR